MNPGLTGHARAIYRRNHLARNSGYIILATAITGIFGLVFWIAASRYFTITSVGTASAIIGSMTFASAFATMGLGTTALQLLPGASDEMWSSTVNAIVFVGTLAGVTAGVMLAFILPEISSQFDAANSPGLAVLLIGGTALLTLSTLLDSIFQAERASEYVAIRGASFGALKLLLLGLPVLVASKSLTWIVASWVGAAAVTGGAALGWQLHRLGRTHGYRFRGANRWFVSRLRLLLLHHATSLGGFLIPSIMPTLVVARLSSESNAYFYIAWLFSSILFTVSSAVAGSLLADLSHEIGAIRARIGTATRLVAGFLVPLAMAVVVLGRPVLGLFGPGYSRHSYVILVIFVAVAIPDAITNIYVTVLRVQHKPGVAALMNVGMAVLALGGAWLLMPELGASGAAWAWAAGQAAGVVFVLLHLHLRPFRTPNDPSVLSKTG